MPGEVDSYSHGFYSSLLLDFAQVLPRYFYFPSASHKSLSLRKRKAKLERELIFNGALDDKAQNWAYYNVLPHRADIHLVTRLYLPIL